MEHIRIEHVSKMFTTEKKSSFEALGGVDLSVEESEFVCILGPSGCGKSTLLRIIAGLETATGGSVYYKGTPVLKPDRHIGMVFQNYSLMPWLRVAENIALGPCFAGKSRKEREEIARDYLRMVGMEDFSSAFPHELSGGMQQRVAIARALANDPDVLLMDEPFGALDAYTRIVLQKELLRIWEHNKKTILFVTHSVDEAIYLADRVIYMSPKPGRIVKKVRIDMPRVRERSDPRYGKLMDELLALFEE